MICYFLTFTAQGRPDTCMDGADLARLVGVLRATPGMTKALVFTPASAHDPYLNDGPCPPLILECYFADIEALEAAIAADGHFRMLAQADLMPSLAGATVTQQAMLARAFSVPDPVFRTAPGQLPCTYVVSYEGMAEDLNLWLSHYIAHHPPIMARFPGIREIEISTRIDWCSGLPWPRVAHMQRNKTVFDSPEALNAALNSPVRDEMRADFRNFPPFSGKNSHYPMTTLTVIP
ncbi:MAG TPA: EthD family reductase [Stellaceae bacterium]|nr:EthD family reductase [Stellaceae bacterium]